MTECRLGCKGRRSRTPDPLARLARVFPSPPISPDTPTGKVLVHGAQCVGVEVERRVCLSSYSTPTLLPPCPSLQPTPWGSIEPPIIVSRTTDTLTLPLSLSLVPSLSLRPTLPSPLPHPLGREVDRTPARRKGHESIRPTVNHNCDVKFTSLRFPLSVWSAFLPSFVRSFLDVLLFLSVLSLFLFPFPPLCGLDTNLDPKKKRLRFSLYVV